MNIETERNMEAWYNTQISVPDHVITRRVMDKIEQVGFTCHNPKILGMEAINYVTIWDDGYYTLKHSKQAACKKTIAWWDFLGEVPVRWCIERNQDNYEAVNAYFRSKGTQMSGSHGFVYSKEALVNVQTTKVINHGDFVELTFDQFKRLVLKETTGMFSDGAVMGRKIVGYKSPIALFGGTLEAGTVFVKVSPIYSLYHPVTNGQTPSLVNGHSLAQEIVETWEPVYEEKPTFLTVTVGSRLT